MEKEKQENMRSSLWDIFLVFCKVGALTFGGGYAMLPIINKEAVERKKWVTQEEVMDYYAVGQCLPGLIAVNTAVFVGEKVRGKKGGIAAALGVTFPSLVIIMIIAAALSQFMHLSVLQKAFYGIRIAVAALILQTIVTMWKKAVKDIFAIAAFAVAFILSAFADVSTVLIIVGAVLYGIVIKTLIRKER